MGNYSFTPEPTSANGSGVYSLGSGSGGGSGASYGSGSGSGYDVGSGSDGSGSGSGSGGGSGSGFGSGSGSGGSGSYTPPVTPAAATVTLSASAATVQQGGAVTFTVDVWGTGGATPTGTVGLGALGYPSATLSPVAAGHAQATLTVNPVTAAPGGYWLYATYTGDATFPAAGDYTGHAINVTAPPVVAPPPVVAGTAGVYGVVLKSASWGEHGSSDLEVSAGGVEVVGDEAGDNYAMVSAASPLDAVRQALYGTLTVGANTYTLTPATLSADPAAHAPFLMVAVGDGYEVRLEDLAATPQACDWDYNDTVWKVDLTQYTDDTPNSTSAVAVPTDPNSPFLADPPKPPVTIDNAPVTVSKQAMTWITEGKVNTKVVTEKKVKDSDPTVLAIEVSLTGGHTDGVFKPVNIKVGANTSAERTVTLTLTGKVLNPKADREKEAFEVKFEGSVNDPGFKSDAKKEDQEAFPKITTVRPTVIAGKQVSLTKTSFPTKWTARQIELFVTAACGDARRKADGTTWVPSNDPNAGSFEATESGVVIAGKWVFDPKKGTMTVAEAFPRAK